MTRWLERHAAMLVEEVVYLAREALRTGGLERGVFDHVIIDEYQDLTFAEQDLVEDLWSERGSLVILGDDNQSIYRFRDNHPQGVAEFAERHPDLLDLNLRDNYRCSPEITDLANTMMAQAGSSVVMAPKRVITAPVTQVYWPSVEEEVAGLAQYINAHPDQSYLVLTPRRFMGYRLKTAVGLDAATSFYEESLESHLARERFTLGSLLANEDDAVAARCWLSFRGTASEQHPSRNAAAYSSLGGIASAGVLREIAAGTLTVSGEGSGNIRRRAKDYARLVDEAPADPRERLLFTFNPDLADRLPAEKRAKAHDDLTALQEAALGILDSLGESDLAKVFNTLRYRIATRTPLRGDEEPRVRIMTLHGAKGLEADAVVLMGAADQVLPGPAVSDPQEQEARVLEQRRLLYVAVTRARDVLIVSWPRSVRFADGRGEAIRNDGVFTRDGEQYYRLSRAALIPPLDAIAIPGERWLREQSPADT
jgi:DNA helicase II / ATP-dependent DNA helicase PcrA